MTSRSGLDPELVALLRASDRAHAERQLARLLHDVARPLLVTIVRRQLGGSAGIGSEDLEDLVASTLLRVHDRVRGLQEGDEGIASFSDYVAMCAYNACASFLMARQPERTRLRYRVRYAIRRNQRLATWWTSGRQLTCGPRSREGAPPVPTAGLAHHVEQRAAGRTEGELNQVVAEILQSEAAPCLLEDLVDCLFVAFELQEVEAVPLATRADSLVAATASVTGELESRERLAHLWREVLLLPPRQRVALLLNLRDATGADMTASLLGLEITTLDELANCLDCSVEEASLLLPSLPLPDEAIARRLGLRRQQVINLRKSARLRLLRRMRE